MKSMNKQEVIMLKFPIKISDNLTFIEAVKSATAEKHKIQNYPNAEQLENMKFLAEHIFEPIRRDVAKNKPVIVSSFFRHKDLNKYVKGASKTSDHPNGCAIDLQKSSNSDYTNADIFKYVLENLSFDQLIWEFGTKTEPRWVHIGYRKKGINRNKVIYIYSK